uniref:Uncharacterized protein n=1 Tax=Rhizophora mucronata TaxID=61149 RepID=A0A2P2L8G3_RHIMU
MICGPKLQILDWFVLLQKGKPQLRPD